jgi:hypothetical protein
MTDLSNRVSKQQLHFMALIIVITLKTVTLKTFWNVTFQSKQPDVCLLSDELNKEGIE